MHKENIKKVIVSGFKLITYILLWLTFTLIMSRVNYAVLDPTRTAVVTAGAFFIIFMIMQYVYGNFEIGFKKSKPVFLTTMISVLLADFVAAVTMIVMGLVQFPVKSILFPTFIHLIFIYIIQGIIIWIMAHLGNDFYFKLYDPVKVMVFNNNEFLFKKVFGHIKSHDKQYEVIGVFDCPDFEKLVTADVEAIYAFGLESQIEDELIEFCYKNNIRLIFNASSYNFLLAKQSTFVIDDVLLIEVRPKTPGFAQLFTKRLMDIVGAIVMIILSIPFYIVISIAIKIEDGGPILFTQERLTKDAKPFKIYKFRSMVVDADNRSAGVDDDRITKVGHIIRKLRVDELPQALNILKGDISLVGPRPESVSNIEMYRKDLPDFDLRLKVKGGLTGYAQIFGKYNTTPEMKLLLDLKYIEDFSILEDIKLILQTLMVFVRPDSTEGFDYDEE